MHNLLSVVHRVKLTFVNFDEIFELVLGRVHGVQTYHCTNAWGHEINNIMSTAFMITFILLSS
jgi:hypothetical protein